MDSEAAGMVDYAEVVARGYVQEHDLEHRVLIARPSNIGCFCFLLAVSYRSFKAIVSPDQLIQIENNPSEASSSGG